MYKLTTIHKTCFEAFRNYFEGKISGNNQKKTKKKHNESLNSSLKNHVNKS